MRFSCLSLERYGRFEDCELDFRPGSPDLHIIYGPNEAGKTTSLSAVSDLLFGFQTRSPYNFVFDYALLRVGAELQSDGQTLACRRKKGTSGTLLDANDAPIDEVALIAMLKGQTRETFQLSFSLDQQALRSGGKAIVEARDDLGRTLFAAGSGLTGVTDKLKALESEADAVWGPTAKGSRTFTQAQKQLTEAARTIRDEALKPKAWSDAKALADRTRAELEAVQGRRNSAQAELRAAERVRRLSPLARQREAQIAAIEAYEGTINLGRQREDAGARLIDEADAAVREQSALEQLRGDLAERRAKVACDTFALAEADEIDRLVAVAGAETKAASDLVTLQGEHESAKALVNRLRAEAAENADAVPERPVAGRLRELAKTYGELLAAGRQIAESREDIDARRSRANAQLAEAPGDSMSKVLIDAVDLARTLGADADARCENARRKADAAATDVTSALARLAPWTGEVADLLRLPIIDSRELDDAREALTDAAAEVRRMQDQARRSSEDADAAALAIAQMETGTAVSPEEIAGARKERDQLWQPLRQHILTGEKLDTPATVVDAFEASVAGVDERLDLRFALADALSRLSLLEQTRAKHELERTQAEKVCEEARGRESAILDRWATRLEEAGLPSLDPARFQTWQNDRARVEKAELELRELKAETDGAETRRDSARAALGIALGIADPGGALAPVLIMAERSRADMEGAEQQRRLVQSELEQVETDSASLNRRQQRLDSDIETNSKQWTEALSKASLRIDISTCNAVLDLLDDLRQATSSEAQLRRRIDGIERDARTHASAVAEVAGRLGLEPEETAACVRTLKERLANARAAATLADAIDEEDSRHASKAGEVEARLKVTEDSLASLLLETKSANRTELSAAIEKSQSMRIVREDIVDLERQIVDQGDGLSLADLVAAVAASDPELIAEQVSVLNSGIEELNNEADEAATAHGDARRAFAALEVETGSAVEAAADAAQAKSELEALAEHYILKRAEAVTLKWAIETYRERNQNPLLVRAGELFSTLTTGRYLALRVDADGSSPRLLGLRDDNRTVVEVDAMSEGTTDQLFLALRLAAVEQSVAAGITLPFLADDLFVNFDDERAEAGFRVLAEVAKSTQVLFFTHHPHLVAIAKSVVGKEMHSECTLQ
jgi:uncharacterized protein YhaN